VVEVGATGAAVVLTFAALYPTTIFVQWMLSPPLKGPVFSNLFVRNLSAAMTVALLVFVVMPRVTRWAAPWLFE
jgi:antibiotic biosynthesis monooxygenase (ABM) superfamily enzyme